MKVEPKPDPKPTDLADAVKPEAKQADTPSKQAELPGRQTEPTKQAAAPSDSKRVAESPAEKRDEVSDSKPARPSLVAESSYRRTDTYEAFMVLAYQSRADVTIERLSLLV